MFNTTLKPNTIVRIGTILGVVEGEDIYRPGVYNIFNKTTRRKYTLSDITEIVDDKYVGSELYAYQVYNRIK